MQANMVSKMVKVPDHTIGKINRVAKLLTWKEIIKAHFEIIMGCTRETSTRHSTHSIHKPLRLCFNV